MNYNNLKIEFHKSFRQSDTTINLCKNISSACNIFDKLNNPFFVDEEYNSLSGFPWLYYATIETEVIGFVSTYIIDSYNVEICIFVLPKYRKNKIATRLFSMMVSDFNSQSFQLSMDVGNDTGKSFVHQMGFAYASTECVMQLDKEKYSSLPNTMTLTPEKQKDEIIITGLVDGKEIGHAVISVFDDTVCIHDVEVFEKYRRNGYGYRLMGTLLNHTFEKYNTAILHVTKENVPAYNLYKKLGFRLEQELSYYEL